MAAKGASSKAPPSSGGTSSGLSRYNMSNEVLGQGTYATVFAGTRKSDGQPVALKRLTIGDLTEEEQQEVYVECELLERMDHPNIVKYYESFMHEQWLFIVMESAVGDLGGLVEKAAQRGTYLKEKTIWNLFYQAAAAIKHMHDNRVMHRDIKPANIFVFPDKRVKIGDLGMGRGFSAATMYTVSFLGSPYYMSPERLQSMAYDYSADVWSLGCVLYELCQLHSPYFDARLETAVQLLEAILTKDPPPLANDEYSADLQELIAQMLDKTASNRPTMDEVYTTARARVAAYRKKHDAED